MSAMEDYDDAPSMDCTDISQFLSVYISEEDGPKDELPMDVGQSYQNSCNQGKYVFVTDGDQCPICFKRLSRNKMRIHLRTHTGEKPYVCEVCQRGFARSDKLTTHKRIHTGEKPHICFCGKRFSRIDHLKVHAATHTAVASDELGLLLEEARNQDLGRSGLPIRVSSPTEYNCPHCNQKFNQSYRYHRHLRVHTGEKPYVCYCGFRYARSERLRKHQIQKHGFQENISSSNKSSQVVIGIPEIILKEVNNPVRNLTKDISISIQDVAKPETNHDTFEIIRREVVIEKVKQPRQQLFQLNGQNRCEFCEKTFKKAHKLNIHRRSHTGEKPYNCESCGKAFSRKDHMLKHMNIHLKRRRDSYLNHANLNAVNVKEEFFQEESEVSVGDFDTEISQGEDKKSFACNVCGHSFKKLYNLQTHMEIHCKRSLYVCGICNKQFKVKKNYEAHLLNHEMTSGELVNKALTNANLDKARAQRAQCSVCWKWVVSQSSLETHMRIHTGERPFKCEFCANTFMRKGDMLRHMKSHTREKPYECHLCPTTFSRKDKLSFHVKRHEFSRNY